MKKRLLFILSFALVLCGSAAAQNKNITNAELEKFREKRQQAERDYRENYEKLGMPSPEELARQDEQRRRENAELAARYRAERLQEEQFQAEREQADSAAQTYYNQPFNGYSPGYGLNNFGYAPYNYFPYGYYNNSSGRRYASRRYNNGYNNNGYNNGGYYHNQLPPIRVLTPSNIIRRVPIAVPRSNPPRGRH